MRSGPSIKTDLESCKRQLERNDSERLRGARELGESRAAQSTLRMDPRWKRREISAQANAGHSRWLEERAKNAQSCLWVLSPGHRGPWLASRPLARAMRGTVQSRRESAWLGARERACGGERSTPMAFRMCLRRGGLSRFRCSHSGGRRCVGCDPPVGRASHGVLNNTSAARRQACPGDFRGLPPRDEHCACPEGQADKTSVYASRNRRLFRSAFSGQERTAGREFGVRL